MRLGVPSDSEEARDTDHDGVSDAYDSDDDGDYVEDADELHNESEASLDTDHDGVDDVAEINDHQE